MQSGEKRGMVAGALSQMGGRQSGFPSNSFHTANPELLKSVYHNIYPLGFNPYAFPARITLAKDHRHATEFGKRIWLPSAGAAAQRVCHCCKNFIDTRQFYFWASFRDVGAASPSYAMYFYFMLFGLFALAFNFLLVGVTTLVALPKARSIFITSPIYWDSPEASANCDADFMAAAKSRGVLALINLAALIGFKYFFFYFLMQESRAMEDLRVTASAFTLRVKTPPRRSEEQIREDLGRIAGSKLQIAKINKVYDISQYMRLLRSFLLAQKRLKILSAKGERDTTEYRWAYRRLKDRLARFDRLRLQFKSPALLERRYTGVAYVTLGSTLQRQALEQCFEPRLFIFTKKISGYSAQRAPEPANIIWHNYGLGRAQKLLRRTFTYAAALLVVIANFGVIIAIKVTQFRLNHSRVIGVLVSLLLSLAVSIVIALSNLLSLVLMINLTRVEHRTLHSSVGTNKVVKVFHTVFLNSAVNLLVSTFIANTYVLSWENREITPSWGLWVQGGVATNTSIVMLSNALSNFIFTYIDPFFLYRVAKRWVLLRRVRRSPSANRVLQCELNEAFEKEEYDLAAQYISLFRVLAVAFFYQPILPYGLALGALELALQFCAQRYFIFYHTLRPRDFDVQFTFQMVAVFQICLVILAAGYVVFDAIANCGVSAFAWTALALALCDWVLGSAAFFQRVLNRRKTTQNHSYAAAQPLLATDYDRLNPLTQRAAMERWLQDIRAIRQGGRPRPAPAAPAANPDLGINHYLQSEAGFGQGTDNLYPEPLSEVEEEDEDLQLQQMNVYNTQKLMVESRRARQNLHRQQSEAGRALTPGPELEVDALASRLLASACRDTARRRSFGSAEEDGPRGSPPRANSAESNRSAQIPPSTVKSESAEEGDGLPVTTERRTLQLLRGRSAGGGDADAPETESRRSDRLRGFFRRRNSSSDQPSSSKKD